MRSTCNHVIRGGTDGSRLTEMALPTPNLFCGEHNAHGPLEWVAVQEMKLAVTGLRPPLVELWEKKAELPHVIRVLRRAAWSEAIYAACARLAELWERKG